MTTPTPETTPGARGAFVLDVADRPHNKVLQTYRALDWLAADPDVRMLVVANAVEREHILAIARAEWPGTKWRIWNVLTAGQARGALGDRLLGRRMQVYVLEVDAVLANLLGGTFTALVGASCTATMADDLTTEPAVDAP